MTLWLDMDGVLADFDKRAQEILGIPPGLFEAMHGSKTFWQELKSTPDFYNSFDLMPDAQELIDATIHLGPMVLTGVPLGDWAEPQKRTWCSRMLPPMEVHTCRSRDKWKFCNPMDILIDDRAQARFAWEDAGGIFIHHVSAKDSIEQLKELNALH